MAIVKTEVPYEILFRLDASGTLQGCHRKDLQVITDDSTGENLSTKELGAMPITGQDMETILGTINVSLTETVTQLQSDIQAKDDQIAQLQSQVQALQNELSALQN